jgi:hypothetical protein
LPCPFGQTALGHCLQTPRDPFHPVGSKHSAELKPL